MASIVSVFQLPLNTFGSSSRRSASLPISALHPVNRVNLAPLSISESTRPKQSVSVRAAVIEDEWGPEPKSDPSVAVLEEKLSEIDVLKKQLVGSFYGTNRGLSASSETRAEIVELITQLEAKNPTPAPTEALSLLNGKWILATVNCVAGGVVACCEDLTSECQNLNMQLSIDCSFGIPIKHCRYTSFAGLFPLLSRGAGLPLVKLEEISQTIDSENFTVQNSVLFSGPLATTAISTNAKFEVRSPKRVQIKFEEGVIGTPQLTDSIELPENVEFLGQKIDLSPFKGLLTSVQDTASSVARTISSRPPIKFSISSNYANSWLLTTYLDNELRISRGDGGSIFVLVKEGCPLLTT
ncbi:plastid-lipid associated protein PAP / fibrillinfamily protein [Striga asiatica]|uniref:Plastid-lipid associated protein PAP / fibrillinfamily protein n=1 Tax=Striga asiatica TaxID=4170 RepID=A0A5A7RGF3_STRAF|nr:plastid-lipid associated protein PAP / fibrillinfamily protein [Striga asiatica]